MYEEFEALLEERDSKFIPQKEGNIASGAVIDIDNKTVTVDIGGKTVAYIATSEFAGEKLEIGMPVDIFIDKIENKKGELIASRENARKFQSWNNLKKCLNEGKTVNGKILGKVKGGFAIELENVIAFLPRSQVDTVVLANMEGHVGKSEDFVVLKIDDARGNVVVSRRAILDEQRSKEREEILSKIKVGDVMKGIVKNITDYGAFVDFGSFDGLLHLTDISWCRVRHPSDALKVGQELEVQIIKYDEETKKVSLGIKQLQENPWETIEQKYPVNSIVKGKVTNIAQYGVFVEIENGIEGLVHVSEMSWLKNNPSPMKMLSIDQNVDVMILDINTEHHRISLGMKQCAPNPWKSFAESHESGDMLEGVIKNITEFGLFVEFKSGIDGLIHISDLDWDDPDGKSSLQKYKRGDKINAVLLGCDYTQERISLGVKQLANKNFKKDLDALQKNMKTSCVVRNIRREFLEAEIDLGLKGIIKKADISSDRKEQRTDKFNIGDRLEATIFLYEKNTGKLTLILKDPKDAAGESESQGKEDEEDFSIEQYMNSDANTTLGSVFGSVFGSLSNK
ncbi:MAG: 30S ribosomal protein S1 [Rickettsiales bacterium]|jgi:small subunit ribosomal protein S1|nr:30S ribosomal protein S1 [Rickettsiales bacterium]